MNFTILLIEDNEANRYLATYLLEKSGHRVTHAPDGPTGLDLVNRHSFDIILLDIQLPRMDGYSVARALRDIPALVAVPIVAITSFAMAGDREKALASGCSDYIEKPINPSTFVADIVRNLPAKERTPEP
jgi:CheY-like chemotaxis protein